jgi:serine/threonine protein kinase
VLLVCLPCTLLAAAGNLLLAGSKEIAEGELPDVLDVIIKVADYGVACSVKSTDNPPRGYVGTPGVSMAPEVRALKEATSKTDDSSGTYDKMADIYSFGAMWLELR